MKLILCTFCLEDILVVVQKFPHEKRLQPKRSHFCNIIIYFFPPDVLPRRPGAGGARNSHPLPSIESRIRNVKIPQYFAFDKLHSSIDFVVFGRWKNNLMKQENQKTTVAIYQYYENTL